MQLAAAASGGATGAGISRRSVFLLAGAGLGMAATGCHAGARVAPPAANSIATVEDLLTREPFYAAHRGSQDNWPEHTAEAYRRSVEAGAEALEISVHRTSDNVFVCHHDPNTLRMTGVDKEIARSTYEELLELSNNAKAWLGPNSPGVPLPKLTDVLDQYAASCVIFLEDKASGDPADLLDIMDKYPEPTRHFVWKQSGTARQTPAVKERGYLTWGYFAEDESVKLTAQLAERFDLVGLHWSAPDGEVERAVEYGKPVLTWDIHTRFERDRMVRLGARGIICANLPYVTTDAPRADADSFAGGLRAAGDLPYALAWTHQPVIQPATASIRLDHPVKASYCMGSMCPLNGEAGYRISFEMRWPDKLPDEAGHAGLAFGQANDAPYRIREAASSGGYHFVQRTDGTMELFGRQAGETSGYVLGSSAATRPVPGDWMRYEVRVTPDEVSVARLDGDGERTVSARNNTYRGGYFFLCRNYDGPPAVEFRSIRSKPAAN
ncbi:MULTISPECIES: glycerophosphodiester phosphodiesterase [unclassified Arthrobacter]|uniref:glycerophosphodiester phosphodiesterase n=1 Tax=unclassified Arthrobacter TaxID=235627 RepID=UPI001D15551A|nr:MULTISPECIES: glycerophosphodiester phosphodiesterase family protein [unclassified Arthrobacter]MCC3277239.1 hypothetical protein [Arthrobacter sp. zg-Y20]MCC9179016.1 hypothetical protein [Arthrobacter sp. zg-Y750]MDK1317399.1 glycerophosphodiester phosphodiesterase family protein [Arthrobacter sp. zg.Y20]WIB07172.1 glycerophosphodiester phosphodiesterase family protein [Arthrobacter sp. zg-Y20]